MAPLKEAKDIANERQNLGPAIPFCQGNNPMAPIMEKPAMTAIGLTEISRATLINRNVAIMHRTRASIQSFMAGDRMNVPVS